VSDDQASGIPRSERVRAGGMEVENEKRVWKRQSRMINKIVDTFRMIDADGSVQKIPVRGSKER